MKRLNFLMLLSAAAVVPACKPSATGGNAAAGGSGRLVVGFSQIGADNPWRTAETESIKSEAAQRGIELKFSDAQGQQEAQISAMRSFIAQGVSAIILAPKVETGWDAILKEARDAKIPVVLVDRGVAVSDDSLFTTLIASDFVAEGGMAGAWLAKKTGGKAGIIQLEGTTGSAPANDRRKGFEAAMAAHPEMKILASQTGDFKRSDGKNVMEALLKAHGAAITAVYAHNDDMAIGAIQALEAAGRAPGKDVTVVSIDGMGFAFEAIRDGKLNCTVECNPLLGPMAFDAIAKALKGETLPKNLVQEDRLFDETNAAAELPNRKY
jgi:simple sugar transport system substrate-binding protein